MLPLQFSQNDCNLTNLSATLLELSQSGLLHGSGDTESNEAEVAAFWAKIDAGSIKRSTIFKKLAKCSLSPSAEISSLVMQFEANVKVGDGPAEVGGAFTSISVASTD